jgi:hypothetical protein
MPPSKSLFFNCPSLGRFSLPADTIGKKQVPRQFQWTLRRQGFRGSATVPVAVGCVPRPTFFKYPRYESFPNLCGPASRQARMCLAGRQTPRAGRTRSPKNSARAIRSTENVEEAKNINPRRWAGIYAVANNNEARRHTSRRMT